MNPLSLPPALLPDTFLLLSYLLIAALLLYLPFLGIIIAGSAASLVLNFFGRENRDDRSLRLSREWIEAVTVNRWVLLLLGLLPYPAIAYSCQRLLGGRASLPAIAWLVPFGALLAGCLLLSLYRSAIRRTTELPAASFRAGTAGLLAMISAAFLSFLLLGTLVNPAKLPLVRSNLVFILSWHSLVGFLLFLALSFGLAGGIALRFLGRSKAGEAGGGPDYEARVRTAGTSFAVGGALAIPALVVLYLITLPVTGLSKGVFAMAATVPILALAVFALLYLLPGKEESRPGDRVSALFGKLGLVDRYAAALQDRDLRAVDIEAEHVIADFGEACPGDEPDVARADHRDVFHVTHLHIKYQSMSGITQGEIMLPPEQCAAQAFATCGAAVNPQHEIPLGITQPGRSRSPVPQACAALKPSFCNSANAARSCSSQRRCRLRHSCSVS